jgi:hypothetical protein
MCRYLRTVFSAYSFTYIVDAINGADHPLPIGVPVGNPGVSSKVAQPIIADGSKAEKVLGLRFRPWEKTVVDTLLTLKERGW